MSKPSTSRGWVCALGSIPVLAAVAVAPLVFSAARHGGPAGTAPTVSVALQRVTVAPAARARIRASYAALPLAFEPNHGQTNAQVRYMARANGYTLFLTANDAVFALHSRPAESDLSPVHPALALRAKSLPPDRDPGADSVAVVRM
ncbi:MAG: hypothetical protein WAM69_12950 [Candidatus Sulfotelmatobacter sp.]